MPDHEQFPEQFLGNLFKRKEPFEYELEIQRLTKENEELKAQKLSNEDRIKYLEGKKEGSEFHLLKSGIQTLQYENTRLRELLERCHKFINEYKEECAGHGFDILMPDIEKQLNQK